MKIDGYITGFWWVTEMDRMENYYDEDFTDAGMTELDMDRIRGRIKESHQQDHKLNF